jgi:PAS domain S-box-containing protein
MRPIVRVPVGAALGAAAAFSLAYFALAELGLSLGEDHVSLFWPASGVAAGAIAVTSPHKRRALLAGLAVATVLSSTLHGTSLVAAIGFMAASGIEALVAGSALGRHLPQGRRIVRFIDLVWLLRAAAVGGVAGGMTRAIVAWMTTGSAFLPTVVNWWIAAASGIVMVAPAVLATISLRREPPPHGWSRPALVAVLSTAAALGISVVLSGVAGRNLSYMVILPLLMSAMILGQRGTAILTTAAALFIVWGAGQGLEPFGRPDSALDPVIASQLFLVVIQFSVTALAIESSRRRDLIAELHGVLDAAIEGVLVVDETGVIRRVNTGAVDLFGYGQDELVGHGLTDFIGPAADALPRTDSGSDKLRLVRGRRADGTAFWAEASQGSIAEPSGRHRYALIVRDVTDRIDAEARVERLQDEFVSQMTHELRTPLTAILGYSDIMLADETLGKGNVELEIIHDSAKTVLEMIDDILAFKRLAAAEAELKQEPIDLKEIAAEAVSMMEGTARARGIGLVAGLQPTPKISGDRRQLQQAVRNLVSNAVKYSHDGGLVEVSTGATDHQVVVGVADHGIGIPSEDQARIFRRFFRAANAEAAGIPGSGLGLVLVREVARAHGGDVSLTSAVGAGTRVTLTLPISHHPSPG